LLTFPVEMTDFEASLDLLFPLPRAHPFCGSRPQEVRNDALGAFFYPPWFAQPSPPTRGLPAFSSADPPLRFMFFSFPFARHDRVAAPLFYACLAYGFEGAGCLRQSQASPSFYGLLFLSALSPAPSSPASSGRFSGTSLTVALFWRGSSCAGHAFLFGALHGYDFLISRFCMIAFPPDLSALICFISIAGFLRFFP